VRFTQEDTYRGDGVENNPVSYVDPSGHVQRAYGGVRTTNLAHETHEIITAVEGRRTGDNKSGSSSKTVYREDRASVVPEDVFQNDFSPKGTHNDALLHTKSNAIAGNFVSTSGNMSIATDFCGKNGYVYVIQTDNYVDINATYGAGAYFPEQMEFSIPGGIKQSEIVGAYKKQGG